MTNMRENDTRPMWQRSASGRAERRLRHRQLVGDVEAHLPHLVTHADTLEQPDLRTELVVPDAVAIPPALSLAISQRGLEILVGESGTQGVGGAMVVVVR